MRFAERWRRRDRILGFGLVVAATFLAGSDASGAGEHAAIHGRVVAFWTRAPLEGYTVAVGKTSTKTGPGGEFLLAGVPPIYDLLVADPDRASISVYRGLRRRDLLLEHRPHSRGEGHVHAGAIEGVLSGGGPYPLTAGRVTIYFHSSLVEGVYSVPAARTSSLDPRRDGPEYGPLSMRWIGPSSGEGELLAVRRPPEASTKPAGGQEASPAPPAAPAGWSFARRKVTLASGQARTANIDLVSVPTFHLALKVIETRDHYLDSWSVYYREPSPTEHRISVGGADRHGRRDPLAYEMDVPDLRKFGLVLCASARGGNGTSTERCGIGPGASVLLEISPSPALSAPVDGAVLTPSTTFAWSGTAKGIYELDLEVWSPTAAQPTVRLYTTDSTTSWPDLGALGMGFPALKPAYPGEKIAYKCTLSSLGPYLTLDEALGPDGLGAIAPPETRRSSSREVKLFPPPPQTPPSGEAPPHGQNGL